MQRCPQQGSILLSLQEPKAILLLTFLLFFTKISLPMEHVLGFLSAAQAWEVQYSVGLDAVFRLFVLASFL